MASHIYYFGHSDTSSRRDSRPRNAVEVLDCLTNYVRVLSDHQLNCRSRRIARATFRDLERRGLVECRLAVVRTTLPLVNPIIRWKLGNAAPYFERAAWKLKSRWHQKPESVLIASASSMGRLVCGGKLAPRPIRRTELCHDLHVTWLFLKLRNDCPDIATRWIHEDASDYTDFESECRPDAIIDDTAVDFGGSYRAAKLRHMHRIYSREQRAYEIW